MADRIDRLATFLRVAERGSLTAAAADLGVSQPTVTRAMAALEAELGVALTHRTTHSVTLTEAGRALLPRARRMVAAWDGIAEDLRDEGDLSGPLHVVAPVALGQTVLMGALARMRAAHPAVAVTWTLTDAAIRMGEMGADLWVRVGRVPDDRLVVREIGRVPRSVWAAPSLAALPEGERPWVALSPYEGRAAAPAPVLETASVMVVAAAIRDGTAVGIAPDWLMDGTDARRVGTAAALPVSLCWDPARRTRRLAAFAEIVEATLGGIVA
ncbi:LysR family transcriptional regulator [Jannaschia sp. Os4]|uniref:LysR family transcriptional regulator n=1 Tax=Jannaschia sp. Os4 TaxID=2807617 RepID=UPI00193947F5|nr:LysR family transcriptional regulator [Jannaschia sp. Os4]MBM2576974.1 LysR family transcriptional regulator [Jannaschia sp. Os4]